MRKIRAKARKIKVEPLTLEQYIAMLKSSPRGIEDEIKRLEECFALKIIA